MEVLTKILAIIGAFALVIGLFDLLFSFIPKIKEKVWGKAADHIKFKKFEKLAIASKVENTVNSTVEHLQTELPKGWINRASIKWVKKETISDLKENEIIIRLKPLQSQDFNFFNGIYYFFTYALFPNTKEVIPLKVRKAANLLLSKRTIESKQSHLSEKFRKEFIDKEINEDTSIASFFGKYEKIDKNGFFTGTFLREIDKIAELSRYNELRDRIEEEINSILDHIIEFQNKPIKSIDETWYRKGPITSYGFLLVARPFHHGSLKPYLKRAKQKIDQGIERLYVMGCCQERKFVKKVIYGISKISEYELVESFDLYRDYRGELGGLAALFIINSTKKR